MDTPPISTLTARLRAELTTKATALARQFLAKLSDGAGTMLALLATVSLAGALSGCQLVDHAFCAPACHTQTHDTSSRATMRAATPVAAARSMSWTSWL